MMKKNKENYLDRIPEKKEELKWTEEDGLITIHIEHKGFYSKIAQKFFHTPKTSDVHLDDYGTFVWKQIDGERSIFDIGENLKGEFGQRAEPLYERLSKFFYILNQEKFIRFKKIESGKK